MLTVVNAHIVCVLSVVHTPILSCYTGRFIMYSGITKLYNRKTVGHVFTNPVQIEETTQVFFLVCFIVVHISAARRYECMF